MADAGPLVSRSVVCPECQAGAVLTYPADATDSAEVNARPIVYVCPNLCAPPQPQLTELLVSEQFLQPADGEVL